MDQWVSARPLGAERYDYEPVWIQVAAQVNLIEQWISGQLAQIPTTSAVEVSLEDLCLEPERDNGVSHIAEFACLRRKFEKRS